MAELKIHKFVAALPGTLEADAIYFVRAGDGYDQYVTNHSGTIVASRLNVPKSLPVYKAGGTVLKLALNAGSSVSAYLAGGTELKVQVTTNG
jgi:hypothetical protein